MSCVSLNVFLKMKKNNLFLILIILLGLFLRFYRLSETAMFIGDQARDYFVARDLLLNHKFPLIGPQTSIPWLHQGPFFYYFLAFFLWIGKFDPIWPVYGTALFGVLAIYLIYVLGKKLFDEKAGLLAAFFYAISPYAILQSRISLHPSILPVFVILFLMALSELISPRPCVAKGYAGGARSPSQRRATVRGVFVPFFLAFSFLIAIQLHLSAILLFPIFVLSWEWVKFKSLRLVKPFILISTVMAFWKLFRHSPFTPAFYWWKIFEEIFSYGNFLAAFLALIIVVLGVIRAISPTSPFDFAQGCEGVKEIEEGSKILLISLLVIICGLTVKNSPAEHPYNLFLPIAILIFSLGLVRLAEVKHGKCLVFLICLFSFISNSYLLISSSYFSKIYGPGLFSREKLAGFIVNDAGGRQISLKRCGPLWDYPSTNLNYEYLVWWLGGNEGNKGNKGDEGDEKGLTYYIFEPKEALKTMEGCWGVEKYIGKDNLFNFNQAAILRAKRESSKRWKDEEL